jgi:GT2 family glycosyltransferase
VVIPCYKYGKFLPECVGGVLDQEGVDVDVTIIDDCSPDDSAAVARDLASQDPRVRVIVHEVNQGHIATYNEGLTAAKGEFSVLLSADDLLTPGSLARGANLMTAYPEVGLVYGFARSFTTVPPPARTAVRSWTVWSGAEWLNLICHRASNPVQTPEVMMRSDTLRDIDFYDTRLPHAADFLMWLRAAVRGPVGRVNGVDQAYYRVHGENMHQQQYPGTLRDLTERHRAFEIMFDEDGDRLPDADVLRSVARRSVAREALYEACQPYLIGLPQDQLAENAETLRGLVEFAERICPESKNSRLRRTFDTNVARAAEGKGPIVPPQLRSIRDRVVRNVRWRRWRRSGVDSAVGAL